jgi:HEAT repeat protein
MLKDEDVFVRMATARVLGELDNLDAAIGLIEALGDAQAAVREAAVVSLRLLSDKDFRFDPLGKEVDRSKIQSAWRKWNEQRRDD